MQQTIPDYLPDVRYFLRNNNLLQPLHQGRVFFELPAPTKIGGWPVMRLYDLGGGIVEHGGDADISQFHIGIECWTNQQSGYQAVRQLSVLTISALRQIDPGALINPSGQTRVSHAVVINSLDSPDPDSGWPRRILDTTWTFLPL